MSKSASKQKKGGRQKASAAERSTLRQEPPPTLLEWAVRGVSALALLALTVYMVWSALQPAVEPAVLVKINRGQIEPRLSGWVVPIEVVNQGSPSIGDIRVTIALVDAEGNVVEEESVTIALLGHEESATAELWFNQDPQAYDLRSEVGSYTFP